MLICIAVAVLTQWATGQSFHVPDGKRGCVYGRNGECLVIAHRSDHDPMPKQLTVALVAYWDAYAKETYRDSVSVFCGIGFDGREIRVREPKHLPTFPGFIEWLRRK
jgi:hypothetical protein